MDLGKGTEGSFQGSQEPAHLIRCSHPFWSSQRAHPLMWCLPIWSGSGAFPQNGRWLRKEVCSTWERRACNHIWSETFSPIPLWPTIHNQLGPQAPQALFQWIQRWAHILSAYDYSMAYRPGSDHANADLLSRLPLPEAPAQVPLPGDTILLMDTLEGTPVTASHIRNWTSRDPSLSTVLQKVQNGWKGSTQTQTTNSAAVPLCRSTQLHILQIGTCSFMLRGRKCSNLNSVNSTC